MKLQKVSRVIAILSWVVPIIIPVFIVTVLLLFTKPSNGIYLSPSCIAASGYTCSLRSATSTGASGAVITLSLGQDAGTEIYNVTAVLSPETSGTTPNGYPTTLVAENIGNLTSGNIEIVRFDVPSSFFPQNQFAGYVWLNYSNTSNGPSTSAVKIATLIADINST